MRDCRVNLNLIELVYFECSSSEHSDMKLILKLGARRNVSSNYHTIKNSYNYI